MNLDTQKEKLNAQIQSLKERIASNQETLEIKRDNVSEDDIASLYEIQAKAQSSIKLDKRNLIAAEKSISRINEGEYEYCVTCDEDINPKRLEAIPTAMTCIDCATIADIKRRQFA